MSNLTKLEFNALHVIGKNYLTWILDAEIYLSTMSLGDTIKEGNKTSEQDKVTSQLKLCGENITDKDMLEKTYSTFNANNMLLQQQYRERGFIKYSELISVLLLAEQNNELLLKNHQEHQTGSTPFPEVNAVTNNEYRDNKTVGRGRGRGHGRGRARDHDFVHGRGRNQQNPPNFKRKPYYQKQTINKNLRVARWLKGVKNDLVDPFAFTYMEVGDFFEDVDVNMPKFGGDEPKNN
ncbi:uncharacterized protein LOC141696104 [Apium graveolens]|uniref:uncharacterized protein LOC141696104 n=1 Tax=Apium graveolens TaxID=4045 RepID=UPI003D79A1FF